MNIKRLMVLSFSASFLCLSCNYNTKNVDKDYLNNLNKVLENSKNKIVTCSDAVNELTNAGYDIENYKFKTGDIFQFAYDYDAKQFIVMSGNEVKYASEGYKENKNTYHLFKVTSYYDASSVYSQYLKSDFVGADELLVTTGLDMGSNNNIKTIEYVNIYGDAKDIVINAKCDYLDVYASKDTIHHFGTCNNLFITEGCTNCVFHEYGESAYIQTKAGEIYLESGSSTDIFEISEGCNVKTHQSEEAYVTGAVNASEVATVAHIKVAEVATADEIQNAIEGNYYSFIRLVGDIEQTVEVPALDINRSLFIDLNGRSISFLRNAEKVVDVDGTKYSYGIKLVNSKDNPDVTCIIMDSQSRMYERSGIYLDDCSFVVDGTLEETEEYAPEVSLCLNSGKVHAVREANATAYAVLVTGNTEDKQVRMARHASFKMYGGYIKTEEGPEYGYARPNFKCLQARGKGAYIEMNYGDIESFNYCISGQGTSNGGNINKVDRFGDTKIVINGGNLIGGTNQKAETCEYTPLFFPAKGEVIINDAYVSGPTCIDAKRGDIKINGGTFVAWGNNPKGIPTSEGGSCADGSVLMLECHDSYAISDLNVEVKDAYMYSAHRYVSYISQYKHYPSAQIEYPSVNLKFTTGNYIYHMDKVHVADEISKLPQVKYEISSEGTWIKK